jgi:hypothetical protein
MQALYCAHAEQWANGIVDADDPVENAILEHLQRNDENIDQSETSLVLKETILAFQASLGLWRHITKEQDPRSDLDVERALKCDVFKQMFAVSVANRIPILVNAANEVFKITLGDRYVSPGNNENAYLQTRRGICGHQAAVALKMFELAGIEARPVEFYYLFNGQRLSHIVPEVFIGSEWRLIDTTYGAFWRKTRSALWSKAKKRSFFELASTDDVLAGRDAELVWNQALFPYSVLPVSLTNPDPFNYLSCGPDVLRGNAGSITISLLSDHGSIQFRDLPNFIGDNRQDEQKKEVNYRLVVRPDQNVRITLHTLGAAFSADKDASIRIGDSVVPYSPRQKVYQFDVVNPARMSIDTEMDVAYVVLDRLEWAYVDK